MPGEKPQRISVREMHRSEVEMRIRYFHDASDRYLLDLGVDRTLLPTPAQWRALHEQDMARPLPERENYLVVWELDSRPVGFSSLNHIVFAEHGFMHLHVVDPTLRGRGLGTEFVRRSAAMYFEVFELQRLFSEPNACNVAPNRTLQRAGFRYLFSHETVPGPINFRQVTTRWVLDPPPWPDPGT
ncbi:MAG: GNAT family protein [Acidimicrobiales bacterium]